MRSSKAGPETELWEVRMRLDEKRPNRKLTRRDETNTPGPRNL
jgi:hypothetical protein